VLLRERRHSDAEARFREALEVDPDCDPAREQLEQFRPTPSPSPEPAQGTDQLSRRSLFRGSEALARNRLAEIISAAGRFRQAGRYHQALPLARNAVEFARLHLGEDHPHYAISLNNLAALYESMGDYAAAEPLHQQAGDIFRAALGEDHPDYATSLDSLAALYGKMGDY